MSVQFQDYYKTLEVPRDASSEQISKAFRRLARKYHPDVNKAKGSEEQFKQINEANEVLSDPEKRARYDQLGENWQAGQEFRPPPGWENVFSQFGGAGPRGAQTASFSFGNGGAGGFSDFFDMLFGGGEMFAGAGGGRKASPFQKQPRAARAEITISLEDAYRGATKTMSLEAVEPNAQGVPEKKTKKYQVKIPTGTGEGSVIRLANLGGEIGDLLITVHVAPDPRFRVEGNNLIAVLPIAPWEAALGGKVQVETLDGPVSLTVQAGSQTGQRLRLRGKGLASKTQGQGDMFVELKIVVPKSLTEREKELFSQLRDVSTFKARTEDK